MIMITPSHTNSKKIDDIDITALLTLSVCQEEQNTPPSFSPSPILLCIVSDNGNTMNHQVFGMTPLPVSLSFDFDFESKNKGYRDNGQL